MEIKEKDEEIVKDDQPCCSQQHKINEGEENDEVTEEGREAVDKMTLLHQALSQASVARAKRCKQIILLYYNNEKSEVWAKGALRSDNLSEGTFHETNEFMEACTSAIRNHKLFPIVELMSKKCEAATQNLSNASFTMDDVFQQLVEMTSKGDASLGNSELDVFLINSIIMLRLHLLELEKVAELCDDFKTKYLQTLRKKMSQESMIGYNGDSDDDLCNSSPELSEQSKIPTGAQTIAMMPTSKGMKSDAQELVEEDNSDSKRKAQLPTKAVELLKTWLFLHSSHPYPSEKEKAMLSRETGLQMVQINNWFINARRRILVQSKDGPDIDLVQAPNPNIDYALIPKRIRCNFEIRIYNSGHMVL
uniref:Homeobox domain-containing protein n=1 Tax=Setaria digitata TaxID=48799 RepID=A0A915Q6M8_9BILA